MIGSCSSAQGSWLPTAIGYVLPHAEMQFHHASLVHQQLGHKQAKAVFRGGDSFHNGGLQSLKEGRFFT